MKPFTSLTGAMVMVLKHGLESQFPDLESSIGFFKGRFADMTQDTRVLLRQRGKIFTLHLGLLSFIGLSRLIQVSQQSAFLSMQVEQVTKID